MSAKRNVVSINVARQEVRLDRPEKVVSLLQDVLFALPAGSVDRIAVKAGVCKGTVWRLMNGNTRTPTSRTMVLLFDALGWTVIARRGR